MNMRHLFWLATLDNCFGITVILASNLDNCIGITEKHFCFFLNYGLKCFKFVKEGK